MTRPTTGWVRALRASVLGSAGFSLALAAHLVGAGLSPTPAANLALLALCVGASVWLTSRRLGRVSLIAVLGGSQLALHGVFMWLTSGGCGPHAPTWSAAMPMPMPGGTAAAIAGACAPMAPDTMSATGAGFAWVMVLAHAMATLTMAWLLAHGESALWRVRAAFTAAFRRVAFAAVSTGFAPIARAGFTTAPRRPCTRAPGSTGRRGPPLRAAAL